MGFLDNILKMVGGGAAGSNPAGAIAGALQQGMGSMDQNSLQGIGQQLLKSFSDTQSFSGTGADAAAQAGIDPAHVEAGHPEAIGGLLELAKAHPEVVQNAVQGVMQNNPALAQQLMPMLGNLLGKA
jgi:hypothetical protein